MSTTKERAYGRMSWGIGSAPEANAAQSERMDHAAVVLNRAADVFYTEAGSDLDSRYQAHPTHVLLAAAALAMEMDGQGVHPTCDSFSWKGDSCCGDEMGALQDAVTGEEWQEIDSLAREILAATMLARIVTLALTKADYPLADMIAGALPEPWDRISGGEVDELAHLASTTALRNVDLTKIASGEEGSND